MNLLPHKYVTGEQLLPTKKILQMWNKTKVTPLGECRLNLRNPRNQKKYSINFVVVDGEYTPLLGASAAQQMKIITVNTDVFQQVAKVDVTDSTSAVIGRYKDVFDDDSVGNLPGMCHLEVDSTICPVVMPTRRVPVSLKARLKAELKRLTDLEVVVPVEQPTDWVNALVVAPKKNGDMRICIDPRPLNQALKRERYQLPVLEDVLPDLAQARVFSTVDLRSGYWHVSLDTESSFLTTFSTPFGRYRWTRLPFGLSVSSEIFQRRLHQAIDHLQGLICIADDIMIYGVGADHDEAVRDHDRKLQALLARCQDVGINLNSRKMKICQYSVLFLGHLITKDGIMPDPGKIEAIKKMPKPHDIPGVQRLNGFVNYLAKFLPHLSDVMAPIRQLTHKHVEWNWAKAQDDAFNNIKTLVTSAPVLKFYDQSKALEIQCDASQRGLGAALLQDGQPLAFISRALTDTESRYAQIEKEMLAIVWSVEKFDQFAYGRKIYVQSDHKPLESIIKKPLSHAPRRLQGMLLRLQRYDVEIGYVRGEKMYLADTLSRAYVEQTEEVAVSDVELVNMAQYLPISSTRILEIRSASEEDPELSALKSIVLQGWPEERKNVPPTITVYFSFRDEISVQDGLLFRGDRVIIPKRLRGLMKEKIHASHMGVESCLRRARECIYWPNMSAELKEYIGSCSTCRSFETAPSKETLMSHDIPNRPWEKVGTDLFSIKEKNYLITVDYFSNFWEIDRLYDLRRPILLDMGALNL